MKGKPNPLLVIALILAAIALYLAVFFIVRGVPEGSYVRASAMGAPTWHFQLEEDVTYLYVRHSYYKDGEFITYGESRYDTDRLLSYSTDIGWKDVALREFYMETTARFTPSFRHFASTWCRDSFLPNLRQNKNKSYSSCFTGRRKVETR